MGTNLITENYLFVLSRGMSGNLGHQVPSLDPARLENIIVC